MNCSLTLVLSLGLAAASHAAVLRGMVVEAQTGRPLARALIVVQPVSGGKGATQSLRTNPNGVFEFPPMPAGAYLITASRRAFAPVQYGQKGWKSSGVPVVLEEARETNLRIALPRYGAITGRIVDENDVGLPEHDVIAYRNARPPVMVGKASTDDRGVYRIFGLEPGAYMIRSATKMYDDGGYLPTFYKDATTADGARPVEVVLDQDVPDITVRPTPGCLYSLGGSIYNPGGGRAPLTVTLVSDMGSESVSTDANGRYKFSPVAPGKYELYAQAQGGRTQGAMAAFQPVEIDRDQSDLNFSLRPQPEVQFAFEDPKGAPFDSSSVQVLARQKQLSGEGAAQFLSLTDNRHTFAPGRWEFSLPPNYAFYVAAFRGPNRETRAGERADGWNEVVLTQSALVKFVLSGNPAAVHGAVTNAARDPVAGVPVYLEPYDAEGRRRAGDLRMVRTDVQGQFRFTGLAPGAYRLLGTFEFQMPDASTMDAAGALVIRAEEGAELAQDVLQYVAATTHQ
ncbi:MAG: carboxypeptidase-like regulatory domain-containing protein [Candidatus Sulfopaludibacter sp.]|nr:carboxypeptidase-like regulatory domain-containing protein [Candidatus Sulfopaludibacter sp.]